MKYGDIKNDIPDNIAGEKYADDQPLYICLNNSEKKEDNILNRLVDWFYSIYIYKHNLLKKWATYIDNPVLEDIKLTYESLYIIFGDSDDYETEPLYATPLKKYYGGNYSTDCSHPTIHSYFDNCSHIMFYMIILVVIFLLYLIISEIYDKVVCNMFKDII